MKKIVCIGGWGHWFEVFQTLETMTGVQLCGIAPAYEGEDLDGICGHVLMADVPRFGKIEELFELGADIAVVSSQPGYMTSALVQAARAGLDIITEKPLGITLEENAAVAAAVNESGVRLMGIFSMRADPVFQTARRLCRDGAVGQVVLVNARKSYKYGDEAARPKWFGQRSVYGGTLPWVGIHALDMIRFTTGLSARRVAAFQRNQIHLTRPDCEDTCCAVLELDGGAQASISVDYFRPDRATSWGDDWIRIVGADGIIEARANQQSVTLLKNSGSPEQIELDEPEPLFRPFIEGRAGLTDAADALELSRAVLYARAAADENKVLEIE